MPTQQIMWRDKYGNLHQTEQAAVQAELSKEIEFHLDNFVGESYFIFQDWLDSLKADPQKLDAYLTFLQGLKS